MKAADQAAIINQLMRCFDSFVKVYVPIAVELIDAALTGIV
jgi:hypothetical protein